MFDRRAQHGDEPGLAGAVRPQQHDAVALADELLAGFEQQPAIRRLDAGVVQRHQHFGMRAAVGQPDGTGGSFEMRRLGRIFQPLGALLQLSRLRQQQVAAGVDADVVELGGLLAQLLGRLQVLLIAPLVGGVGFAQGGARPRIGQ